MRLIYNTPGALEKQGALGCIKDGALVPYRAPEIFDRNGKTLEILGVGNCSPRLLAELDPRKFLAERLVLPEDELDDTASGFYRHTLPGPLFFLLAIALLFRCGWNYLNPKEREPSL